MLRLLPFLLVMTGCKSCAERRAERAEERAMDVLLPAMEVEPVEVVAEVEEREDGGVEAWGDEVGAVELVAPAGWALDVHADAPAWVDTVLDGGCPDDVPLVWFMAGREVVVSVEPGRSVGIEAWGGGCDADGDDIRGDYEAGYSLDIEATNDDGDSYSLSLVVPVELSIK